VISRPDRALYAPRATRLLAPVVGFAAWLMRPRRQGRRVRTTRRDETAARHPDLVNRRFTATAPNELWVMNLTYVATWSGMAYVWFITDAFSRIIVGWRVASHMKTAMVLDALEMPRWTRGTRLEEAIRPTIPSSEPGGSERGQRHTLPGVCPGAAADGSIQSRGQLASECATRSLVNQRRRDALG
jgi:transposase InsO family protein